MHTAPLPLLGFGFLLGLRHALDVDHLAAVSTILSQRKSLTGASMIGALWGLGHTASLLTVALVVIALGTQIPPRLEQVLELGVALMLIGLGLNLLRTVWRGGAVHLHSHAHHGHVHYHPHVHATEEAHATAAHHHPPVGRKPFFVGMVHGLAGSAGLMLAVLATIQQPALAVVYVVIFGIGSIGGMVAMSLLLSVPLAIAGERLRHSDRAVRTCAAMASVLVGLMLAWEIGMESGALL